MKLNPARSACHRLPAILRPPALKRNVCVTVFRQPLLYIRLSTDVPDLDEWHADGAHPGERVDRLEPVIDWLRQLRGELLIVENFQIAPGGNFAHCGRVPPVALVTIRRLQSWVFSVSDHCHEVSSRFTWTNIEDSDWHSANTSPPM